MLRGMCSVVGASTAPVLYGSNENPNIELCSASRGSYSFCIEAKIMMLEREEKEDEEREVTTEMLEKHAY